MELKEFIKDTITQIAEAVQELNGNCADYPLIVNPPHKTFGDGKPFAHINGVDLRVSEVLFNVILTEAADKASKFGVGLANIGLTKNRESNSTQNTSLSFPLYVSFPAVDMEAKNRKGFPFSSGEDDCQS